jgi:hypothetical protein
MKFFSRILLLFVVGLSIISCKKDEESFTISDDLLTPKFSFNGYNEYYPWKGEEMFTRITVKDVTSNSVESIDEITEDISDKEMFFRKNNGTGEYEVIHDLTSDNSDETVVWRALNNDRIEIVSAEIEKPLASATYYYDITKVPEGPYVVGNVGSFMHTNYKMRLIFEREERVGTSMVYTFKEYKLKKLVPVDYLVFE